MTRHIIDPQNIRGFFNQNVQTPLGEGRAFGLFQLKDAGQESIGQRIMVRLPVDEKTRPHLRDENCLTPYAESTAIFTFPHEEVTV